MPDHLLPGDPNWGWEFGCEDFVFARLDEATKTGSLPPSGVASLRTIAAWHSTYVDGEGRSWGRCFTCAPSHGLPCTTMRALASIWRDHGDYRPGWADTGTFLADVIGAGGFRREYLDKTRSSIFAPTERD